MHLGVAVITQAQLHSTRFKLRLCTTWVQILPVAFWRSTIVKISDNGPDWK